jgi:UDP-N-acetylmuramoyl-L-alanyl-D-glutamate--2,6-diaminopimelate ligase
VEWFVVKLKHLLKHIPPVDVIGSREIDIGAIVSHSRFVVPGSLFVARRGLKFDGNKFIPEAIASGAVCIVSDVPDPSLNITQLITNDVAAMEAHLAAAFWKWPSRELTMVGITGTSGKTTTSSIVHQLFSACGMSSGLIGTVINVIGTHRYEATHTTPDVVTLQRLLREVVKSGSTACVMEVSSHALHQGRVANVEFDTAIFTNLTHEHLDYHKTMDEYARAKNLLFRSLGKKGDKEPLAIINGQDQWSTAVCAGTKARIVTYAVDAPADVTATALKLTSTESTFDLSYGGKRSQVVLPLVGRFNVANAIAASAVFLARGYPIETVALALASVRPPPGRLERVANERGLTIYIDYAHKEDALRKVLRCLRESTEGRLITVFGCGGDRDREKRPKMARASEELSDITIVTSDNPRSEDPQAIIDEVCSGFTRPGYLIQPDRREAIFQAIQMACPDDVVLIAGKGHEKYQIFAHDTVPFDDYQVAVECCILT